MSQARYSIAFQAYRNGDLSQAETLLNSIVNETQDIPEAWHLLGIICYQTHRAPQAISFIQKALSISPRNVDYLNNFGLALRADQQYELALKSFQQALLLNPKDLDVQLNIANLYLTENQFEEAANYYRRLLKLQPKRVDIADALCHALSQLGNAAHSHGQYIKAESFFNEATRLQPQDAYLHYNLANTERELGKLQQAQEHYEKALTLNPDDADIYNNLGNVQRELGRLDLAILNYENALQIDPKLYHAKVHLVHQKQHCCDWQHLAEDIQEISNWVENIPEAQVSPFAFLAMPNTSAAQQKKCANNWIKNRYSALISQRESLHFVQEKQTKQKLKIGYLSADFRLHPLAFLISELIETHDRTKFEIIAYSFGVSDQSSARNRLVKAFDAFHDIRALSEIDAAKKIYADHIDILVDLTGFTQTSRSGIAALKPAKIHVNWLGFPGTMGNITSEEGYEALFDYILTDAFICPPEHANQYAEKLAYLPCYQPNDSKRPIAKTPTRAQCHLPENGFVFCCFNQSFKITDDIFKSWMRILQSCPNSFLWLLECNPWATKNLLNFAEKFGLAKERIVFAPRIPIAEHLARHVHIDLFLDTTPYNAHTTCSDALWMNTPVLTLVGNTFSSRVAGSLIESMNLTELITYQLQDYENKAIFYFNNPEKLSKIKQKIQAEKLNSTLFNISEFTKNIESAYLNMINNI